MGSRTQLTTSAALLAAFAAAGTTASAAVITDRALVGPGADVFDPAGNEEVDFTPSPSADMATLEARTDLRSVQDFSGFTTGNNTLAFTDPLTPDVQFRIGGTAGDNAGSSSTQGNLLTSPGAAYTIDSLANTPASTFTIDFGSYDALTGLFVSAVNPVAAAGFTLTQIASPGIAYNIEFQTDAGVTLQTVSFNGQIEPGQASGGSDYFVGFDNGAVPAIGQIVISRTGSTFNNGLDDFGFTVVPEPASLALLATGGLCLLTRRRSA